MTFFATPRLLAITALAALSLTACNSSGAPSGGAALPKTSAPAGKSWSQVTSATADGMLMGNPNAPLKLVEFASFTCSHCAQFSITSHEELQRDFIDTGRVSLEIRPFIRDALDLMAATIATCAGPDRFFPLAQNIFATQEQLIKGAQDNPAAQQSAMALPEAQRFPNLAAGWKLTDYFAARGITGEELNRCLGDTAAINKRTEVTERNAKQYEISGTPTFLLNGAVIEDVAEWPKMRDALKAAGAR